MINSVTEHLYFEKKSYPTSRWVDFKTTHRSKHAHPLAWGNRKREVPSLHDAASHWLHGNSIH
jgi:hypothetical protein